MKKPSSEQTIENQNVETVDSKSLGTIRNSSLQSLKDSALHSPDAYWAAAFLRQKGFFTNSEQSKLRYSKVAIAGLGAVGGSVFLELVRSGIGYFTIADFDTFESANLNRQNGARANTLGRKKIDVLCEEALQINPFLVIRRIPSGVTTSTLDSFLHDVDLVVDAMDFFAYKERLSLLVACRKKNLFVISSGNVGFGASLLIFDPHGMELEKFLGVPLTSSKEDLMAAFALAWIPRQLSSSYTNPSFVSLESKVAPATGIAALLAGAMISTEVLRFLLKHPGLLPVPHYVEVDVHEGKYIQGKLRWGNKSVWQKIRRYVLINHYWGKKKGFKPVAPPGLPNGTVTSLPVPDDVIRAIVTAGIQAPSGDNIQPWLFEIKANQILVTINKSLDESYFNFKQIPSLISLGAVVENCKIAASSYGLETRISYEDTESKHITAVLTFALSDEPRDYLFDSIWERNTNRRQYFSTKIPQKQLNKLQEVLIRFPDVIWHEVSDRKVLQKLARAVYLVDIIRSERKDLHEHIQKMLRFTQESVYRKRDGFPLRNLKAGWFGELFLMFTHPWKIMKFLNYVGFSYVVARFVYKEVVSSSTLVLITIPTTSPMRCVEAGRALERIWLEATNADIAFQPMAGFPMFLLRKKLQEMTTLSVRHQKFLLEAEQLEKECFKDLNVDTENQVMLFRLGYAKPIEVGTLRRNIDSFIR